jgi:hypothetical protein
MESNVINVNIQLPNNTFLDNYEIPSEKTVAEVLQDLQDAFHIPKFVENNQFMLSLVFKGYVLPSSDNFGEMGIKPDSFLKVKKIVKTKITESDFYQSKTPQLEPVFTPVTVEILEIPDQPSPTLGLLEINAENEADFLAGDFHEAPTEIPNVEFTDLPAATPVSNPPAVATPPKKGRSKILTAMAAILGTFFVLALLFGAFIVFQFGFFGSKLNIPFNVDVNLNTNTNGNYEVNTNANAEANTNTNVADVANTDSNTNTSNEPTGNANVSTTPNVNTPTTTPETTANVNKEASVGISSDAHSNPKEVANPVANTKPKANANTNVTVNTNTNTKNSNTSRPN